MAARLGRPSGPVKRCLGWGAGALAARNQRGQTPLISPPNKRLPTPFQLLGKILFAWIGKVPEPNGKANRPAVC